MSTDCAVFAERSKQYVQLDRHRYVMIYDTDVEADGTDEYRELHARVVAGEWVTRNDMLRYLVQTPKVAAHQNSDGIDCGYCERCRYWCQVAHRFVETLPMTERVSLHHEHSELYEEAVYGGAAYADVSVWTQMDRDDPRKPYVAPPVPPDTRTPEQKAQDYENVQQLVKALEAGYRPMTLDKGRELKVEPLVIVPAETPGCIHILTEAEFEGLEKTIKTVSFDDKHVVMAPKLPPDCELVVSDNIKVEPMTFVGRLMDEDDE